MRARRTAATTTALLATLALAACEKPTPPVTLYSSGTAVDTRASMWCFEGQEVEAECRQEQREVPRLPVTNGQFAINVDSEIAERGWYVSVGGQAQQEEPIHEDYYTYPNVSLPPDGVLLEIVVTDGEEGQGRTTGRYQFQLAPE